MFVIKDNLHQRQLIFIILINYQLKAICERKKTSAFYPKFVASSATNVTLSVLKDKAYAAMFGKGDPRPMSYKSMGKNTFLSIIDIIHNKFLHFFTFLSFWFIDIYYE
jgi:hypothetical protein